jgi:hypothetical protein
MGDDGEAFLEKIARHGFPHQAKADESDGV